jgi:hypothetical protein
MAQTMTMGQAAGMAAAMAVQSDNIPADLSVRDLQDNLLAIGAKFGDITIEL